MSKFLDLIKNRRSIYDISKERVITDEKLKKMLEDAILHTPSAFNSQTARVVLLLDEASDKLWSIVLETLRKKVPADKFHKTEEKIAGFASGYGTILFFEDTSVVKKLQKDFPSYADNFPLWSQQASGMLQFAIWTALENEGLGGSLQHYNPIIDDEVKETWGLGKDWQLISQMPIGKKMKPAGDKEFNPIEERFKVFEGKK